MECSKNLEDFAGRVYGKDGLKYVPIRIRTLRKGDKFVHGSTLGEGSRPDGGVGICKYDNEYPDCQFTILKDKDEPTLHELIEDVLGENKKEEQMKNLYKAIVVDRTEDKEAIVKTGTVDWELATDEGKFRDSVIARMGAKWNESYEVVVSPFVKR